jgi:hypothetical protein
MARPSTREGNLSSSSISALNGGHEHALEPDKSSWDPEEVHQRAIFYAGSRVYLCPGKEVGNPDALTPQEGLGIPRNRAARTELYKQKLEADKRAEVRSKMTKKERAEEVKKSQDAMKLFKEQQPGDGKKKPKPVLPEVVKKPKGLKGLMDNLAFEDRAKWEQCTQAGCTFWRQVDTREVRLLQPPFKGVSVLEAKEERYALGTGSLLYSSAEFSETRAWLVQKAGAHGGGRSGAAAALLRAPHPARGAALHRQAARGRRAPGQREPRGRRRQKTSRRDRVRQGRGGEAGGGVGGRGGARLAAVAHKGFWRCSLCRWNRRRSGRGLWRLCGGVRRRRRFL